MAEKLTEDKEKIIQLEKEIEALKVENAKFAQLKKEKEVFDRNHCPTCGSPNGWKGSCVCIPCYYCRQPVENPISLYVKHNEIDILCPKCKAAGRKIERSYWD